jgi:transcriptional regulator with XRE-family HTH domain
MFAVKLARTALQIGQRELATRAGISVRELGRIERSEAQPRLELAQRLDKAFTGIILDRAVAAARETEPTEKA